MTYIREKGVSHPQFCDQVVVLNAFPDWGKVPA